MKCPKKTVLGALALALAIAALGMWSDPPARAQETPKAGGELVVLGAGRAAVVRRAPGGDVRRPALDGARSTASW